MKQTHYTTTLAGMLLILLCFLPVASPTTQLPPLNLSFMPFDVQTVVPVTADNIDEQGRKFFFLGRHVFVGRLRSRLLSRSATGQLDTTRIRLKADFGPPTGIILADQDGLVLDTARGLTYRLTKDAKQRIERELASFVGVVDVTTSERERPAKTQ